MNQREISVECRFEQVGLAVCFDLLLSVFDGGSKSSLCENAAQPIPAATDALDKSPLGDEFNLQFTRRHLPLRFRIEADVAGDQLANQLGHDKLPDALFGGARVIGDDSQVAFSLTDNLVH